MPQKLDNINDVRSLQYNMAEGTRRARYVLEPEVKKYVASKEAKRKEYTRENTSDPRVRAWQKSYYRGDQGQKPLDPNMSNPNDQQLRDLYEGSGKYYGYGASALGGSNGSYPNQGKMSKALGVKNTKAGM
jgi:hypothetical protein